MKERSVNSEMARLSPARGGWHGLAAIGRAHVTNTG
jgi:hypothetical protein